MRKYLVVLNIYSQKNSWLFMKLVFFDFKQNVNMSTGFCSFLLCDSRVVTCSDRQTDRQMGKAKLIDALLLIRK